MSVLNLKSNKISVQPLIYWFTDSLSFGLICGNFLIAEEIVGLLKFSQYP
jgi:hypothetical protein